MRPDMDVKLDVEIELRSDPAIPESDIAVTVNDGALCPQLWTEAGGGGCGKTRGGRCGRGE